MATKTEISRLMINFMGRLFPVSNSSETMEITDCEIDTNEINDQDMNRANEYDHNSS